MTKKLTKEELESLKIVVGCIFILVVSAGRFIKNGGCDLEQVSEAADEVADTVAHRLKKLP